MRDTREHYSQTPHRIEETPLLDVYAKAVLGVIRAKDGRGDGCRIGQRAIAEKAPCSRKRAMQALALLEERGYIRREGHEREAVIYYLLPLARVQDVATGTAADEQETGPGRTDLVSHSDQANEDLVSHSDQSGIPQTPAAAHLVSHSDQSGIPQTHRRDIEIRTKEIKKKGEGESEESDAPPAQDAAVSSPPPTDIEKDRMHRQRAVAQIAKALISARASTVAVERKRGTLDRLEREIAQQIIAPLIGDERKVTTEKIIRCISYLRTTPFFTQHPASLMPKHVMDDLGPWLQKGEPACYAAEPAPRSAARMSSDALPVGYRRPVDPAAVAERRKYIEDALLRGDPISVAGPHGECPGTWEDAWREAKRKELKDAPAQEPAKTAKPPVTHFPLDSPLRVPPRSRGAPWPIRTSAVAPSSVGTSPVEGTIS